MFALFQKLVAALRAWRERELAYQELMSLDDRTLADIGIRRADIPYVIAGEKTRGESESDAVLAPVAPRAAANSNTARRAA